MALGEVRAIRDYYHRILPYFEEELRGRGDENFWTWIASEPPGCQVLELGAGTGRATRFLSRSAGRVVALDLSAELTAKARQAGVPRVQLLVADMREIHLAARFDLVAAVDDPFVHLIEDDDRERAFTRAAEHLAPNGRFVIDAAWFPPKDRHHAAAGLVREKTADDGRLRVRQVWRCDPATRLCTARFEYRQDGKLAAAASFHGRLWSVEELNERARAAGLRISRLWGDYDRRPWDRRTSCRLIAEMSSA